MHARRRHPARLRPTYLVTIILAATALVGLVACGASPTATPAAPTVGATATRAATTTPRATGVRTTVPTSVRATTPVTASRPVPTPQDITGGVLPTAQAFLTQVAGGAATPGTPGPQATVTGQVTDVDPIALIFTVQGTDGKSYAFLVSAASQVDLVALANNLFTQQQVTVTYRGTSAPYEVLSVR